MTLELLLQVAIALLVVVSAVLVSIGYQIAVLPILAATAAAVSVYCTDYKRWIRLPDWGVNFGGAAIFVFVVSSIRVFDSQGLLTGAASLLLCLQVVLFFQAKSERVYWQIAMTSLLCVVVSAAIVEQAAFGFWIFVYLFTGLFALCVFFVFRQVRRSARFGRKSLALGVMDRSAYWRSQPSRLFGDVYGEITPKVLGWALFWQVVRLGMGTIVITILVFLFTPRRPADDNFGPSLLNTNEVGFSPNVKLGEIGTSAENPEAVMQLRFENGRLPGQSVQLLSPPLVRGTVLNFYENGEWKTLRESARPDPVELSEQVLDSGAYLQEITLEPLSGEGADCAFAVYPPAQPSGAEMGAEIQYDRINLHLLRPPRSNTASIRYKLATTGIWKDKQLQMVPVEGNVNVAATMLSLPARGFDNLRRIADEVLNEAQVDRTDKVQVAKALSNYLSQSGRFAYSLTSPIRAPDMDPIEDFVANGRGGNCEYFASALTLMLRSQRIPARMVVGFKADEWNSLGQFYQVRQEHAHAWVEAYLLPIDVPEWPEGHPVQVSGRSVPAWLVLDPTPSSEGSDGELKALSWYQSLRQWSDFFRRVWTDYVIGLSAESQEYLFAEQWNELQIWFKEVVNPGAWRAWWRRMNIRSLAEEWFNWRGGLAFIVAALSAVLVFRALRWSLGNWLQNWSKQGREKRRRQVSVEFYRRFESMAGWLNIIRQPSQTAMEFAGVVSQRLKAAGHFQHAELPGDIARIFQSVRYGHHPLDKAEVEQVERSLQTLAEVLGALNPSKRR